MERVQRYLRSEEVLPVEKGDTAVGAASITGGTFRWQEVKSPVDSAGDDKEGDDERPAEGSSPAPEPPSSGLAGSDELREDQGGSGPPTLEGIDLSVDPGQFVAVVGQVGSGKTCVHSPTRAPSTRW